MEFIKDHGKLALVLGEKEYSYKDVIKGIKHFGEEFSIEKGERAIVFMENRPEIVFSMFSTWTKKGVSINLDGEYEKDNLLYVIKDAAPTLIFTSNKNIQVARDAVSESGNDIKIINVDEIVVPDSLEIGDFKVEVPDGDETVLLLYTSGTTGNPKGVMLTMDNLMSNIKALEDIDIYSKDDRFIALLPFHHVLPLTINMLAPLYRGASFVIAGELSSDAIRGALKKYKITIMVGVPRVWELLHKGIMKQINSNKMAHTLFSLCKKVKSRGLSKFLFKKVHEEFGGHLRIIASGGAKLDPQIMDDMVTLGFMMLEGYGLTETSPIITFNRPNKAKVGSAGQALPNVNMKINDDGELVVKGPNVMKGYLNNPQATSEAIDKDGWFHTGDLGEIKDEFLYILGRKKEMIVLSNGKNINPVDIEQQIIGATDLIEEIGVIEYNNHLLALIYPNLKVVHEKKIANIKEALKWVVSDSYNVDAPNYRKVLEIKVVKDELPKTKLGKLRRFMLKDIVEGNVQSEEKKKREATPEDTTTEFAAIKKYIMENHGVEAYPEHHLELDLGMDSLDVVELLSYIETTFSVEVKEEDLSKMNSIGELCKFIRDNGGSFEEKDIDWQKILEDDGSVKGDTDSNDLYNLGVKGLTYLLLRPFMPMNVKGVENIPNKPSLFIGNHQSFLDGMFINALLPSEVRKRTYYLAISFHFDGAVKSFLGKKGKIVKIDANKNLRETLQIAAKVLRDGNNLVIFPEGARTRDGEVQEFKKTFAILGKELNVPVIPFGMDGSYQALPYGSKFIKRSNVNIEFLKEIETEGREVDDILKDTKGSIVKWLEDIRKK